MLSATRKWFSLEIELDELEVLKKPAAKTGLNAVPAYGY